MHGDSINKKRLMKVYFSAFISLVLLMTVGCSKTTAEEVEKISRDNIKVACLTSEEYYFYRDELNTIGQELSVLNMISDFDTERKREDTSSVWEDLTECSSDSLTFLKSAYYQLDIMSDVEKQALLNNEDVDLMLVFGSSAGKFLTANASDISYDYMVFGSADPVSSGIIKSAVERYNDKSFAHLDASRIGRQIDMAYEVFKFNDVGVVYEDNDAAYSYSGIGQLEEKAGQYGFAIHRIYVDEAKNAEDYDRYYSELKAAYQKLIPDIDVLYITTGTIEDEKLPWLLSDVIEAGIPTVAETSESQVEWGAMMHITMSDPVDEGDFAAETIKDYMSGTPIDKLDQVYELAPKILLNRDTIKKTGVKLPMKIYLLADRVYPARG